MDRLKRNRLLYDISAARVLLETLKLQLLVRKYSPTQPRVPAGQPTGGQWTDWEHLDEVAGRYNELNSAKCEAQYESDLFQCDLVSSGRYRSACREQAMVRRTTCMKDQPIPPLVYYLGDRG